VAAYLSAAELAEESAETPARLEWLEQIGILRPAEPDRYVPGDAFRARMVGALLDAGFTPDEVGWAASEGALDLSHIDAYPLTEGSEPSTRSFEEFADSEGVSTESTLPELYRVLGLPEPASGSNLRRDEEELLSDFLRVWRLALDEDAATRAARLIGQGTRLAAMGWSELFGDQVAGVARDRYVRGEIETYPQEIIDGAAAMMRLLPRMMAWLARRYTQQAVVAGIVENFEALLSLRGLPRATRTETPPAVVFVDLSGFTELTEERGDDAAVRSAASLQREAEAVAGAKDGRLVKLLGDGAMLYFRRPEAAVDAALELTRTLGADVGLPIHAGAHAGPVVERDRDVFGRTVNLASRIADAAGPNEVVVSDAVVEAVGAGRFRFEPMADVELKVVAEPVRLFRAGPA
jgi:adenylate cyclase